MTYIDKYKILETIHKTRNTVVYRAQKDGDFNTYVIKYLRAKYPSSYEISRFKQEYEIIRNLNIDGVIKTYELISYDTGIALVLEDFDAVSLKDHIRNGQIDLELFFSLGLKIAEILGTLHKKNIVHRDIKPENILVSKEYKQVKITDFGISQIVTHENEEIYHPDVIEGTLKYMSPEQTGRMNRAIDYRTDLYSLGITFYEMLTGTTPFNFSDPLEIIHAHIAREVTPPDKIVSSIPKVISDIIHKLLIKPAEERYQNAFGLLYDLRYAFKQWKETGEIKKFELATQDFSLKFNIPQQMVGREAEIRLIMESFDRAVKYKVPEIMFITGYPGVGKSFLVDELYKPIVARNGYLIYGKYEQFRKDVPYSAIIQAFIKLIQQILLESKQRIESWRKHIQKAIGENAKVITDFIPQLKTIIGEPPEVPELKAKESVNRFHYVCKNFLQVFTTMDHPLVFVLDDLQWADMASLDLIQHVFNSSDNGSFLFIGIYRDDEVHETHAVNKLVERIQATNLQMKNIHINPLDQDSVRRLLSKFLRLESEYVSFLAEIIHTKTNGNPFFINQFMKRLYEKNMLEIDSSGRWKWDEYAVRNMQMTDNVVDLMVQKIKDISQEAQEVLKTASCIGNRFDLETMCKVKNKTSDQILNEMKEALDTGLVFFKKDTCYFLHDRIQEAAYSLISEKEKSRQHYIIGNYIYRHTTQEELHTKIFYIVNQLNAGISQIVNRDEKLDIAGLNLLAGKKAKDSAAYHSALSYFRTGISFLQASDWNENYQLIFDLYINTAECLYLNAEFSNMENYLKEVLQRGKDILDRSKAYEIRIQAYMAQNRLIEAVQTTKNILSSLGVKLPRNIDNKKTLIELYKTKLSLGYKTNQDIINLPHMKDPYSLATIRIATSAGSAFYSGGYTMDITFIVLKMVRLTIRQGIAPQTPFWFSCYAMVLHAMNQLEYAFSYSDIALSLREKLSIQKIRSKLIIYCYINNWRAHIRDSLTPLLDNYYKGFQVGDVEYSLLSATFYTILMFDSGKELNILDEEITNINNATQRYNMETAFNYNSILHQVVHNLLGNTEYSTIIKGDKYDKTNMLAKHKEANDKIGLFLFYFYSSQLNYLFGDIDEAYNNIENTKEYLIAVTGGMHQFSLYYFYRALIILAKLTDFALGYRKKMLKKIEYYKSKIENWAKYAPMNFEHKYLLINAELARIKGNTLEAQEQYEKAIKKARENEYIQEEALALELSAYFYLQRGFDQISGLYFSQALDCYTQWGATAKVEQLKSKQFNLINYLKHELVGMDLKTNDIEATTTGSGSEVVDLHTVLKASQAISGEIILEKVLEQLMKIGIENAGAQRGVLIFEQEGELFIEAESYVSEDIEVLGSIPIEEYSSIPRSVVNYVFKTNEYLVLDNASEDERFAQDTYIKGKNIKSILCMPLRQKSEETAILYLENNLTTNAFTSDRFEVLRVISSQAAISIENARLFEFARRDGLTELINYRYFKYSLHKNIEEAKHNNQKVSLLMIDIDHFKEFNDTHGHQAGDLVLKEVAEILKSNSPDKDLVGRYGGEEFAVIFPRYTEDQVRSLAERIRREVEAWTFNYQGHELKLTISVGMATFPYDASNAEELIQSSDNALYKSKNTGRNRVTMC